MQCISGKSMLIWFVDICIHINPVNEDMRSIRIVYFLSTFILSTTETKLRTSLTVLFTINLFRGSKIRIKHSAVFWDRELQIYTSGQRRGYELRNLGKPNSRDVYESLGSDKILLLCFRSLRETDQLLSLISSRKSHKLNRY